MQVEESVEVEIGGERIVEGCRNVAVEWETGDLEKAA